MKLIKPAFLICSMMFLTVFPSIGATDEFYYFESDDYSTIAADKFLGGMTNLLTGAFEVPKSVINANNEYGFPFAITAGVLEGLVNLLGRTMVGVVEVITFPIPTKPIPQPAVIWNDFDAPTYYDEVFRLRD